MTFIVLDNKDWCKGIYHKGELHFDKLPDDLSRTWKYASYLSDRKILYASLYAQGRGIDEVCPEWLLDDWKEAKKRLKAYQNSFLESKISLEDNCFFDLVPKQFLKELCEVKAKIVEHVFDEYEKPKNYDLLDQFQVILSDISNRELNLDLDFLKKDLMDVRKKAVLRRIGKSKNIHYNLFGTKTGRLTTQPKTFPILNIDKECRSVIKPTNDLLVELDYNAAEARTLFALSGKPFPEGDLHKENAKKLGVSREEAKTQFFAWLYGSKQVDASKFEKMFDLQVFMKKYFNNNEVINPFGRKIKSDNFHSLNYLIQSTCNDIMIEQIVKVSKLLKNKKTFIAFVVHDSFVLDVSRDELEDVKEVAKVFSNNRFGTFPVNISAGKDYGTLRKLTC